MRVLLVAGLTLMTALPLAAQTSAPDRGPQPIQHGAQPNPEVRPPSPQGDSPSAAAGELTAQQARRIFGLPVNAVLVIAGALLVLLGVAGFVIPRSSRRQRARGGGSY